VVRNETASRVEGVSVERLTTMDHPSVSIHVESGENERKKREWEDGGEECRG
jgi:hypothetical protein